MSTLLHNISPHTLLHYTGIGELPSVLWRCWLGSRKGIRPVKNMGDDGGGHWLVWMEWHPAGWSVCLPLLIFPCTIKSRSSLLAEAHPGGPGKQAVKRLWCGVVASESWSKTMHLHLEFWVGYRKDKDRPLVNAVVVLCSLKSCETNS